MMAFLFLFRCLALALLAFRSLEIFAIFLRTFLIGGAGFMQGNCDRLTAAFYGLSGAAFELAMLVLMHNAAHGILLPFGFLRHLLFLVRLATPQTA